MRPQVGEVINGKYRLLRLIGEGGMGSVYEARHEYLGSAVALKFLDPDLARRPGLVARFLQEARVSAAIRSPHVVQVSDVDQSGNGLPYLVMELLEGESLQRALARTGRLPIPTALEYAVQMLNGLEAAHNANVVHRDLKPDNVFLVPTRQGLLVKLLDFGIAKLKISAEFQKGLTRPGVLMGTPEYMAPEQAFSADTADLRADLYSLGVIIFEMITGRRPVSGDDPRIMAASVMAGRVPAMIEVDPSVPPALSAIVQRAMAGRPSDRFHSAAEMQAAIVPFLPATPTPLISSYGAPPAAIPMPPQPVPVTNYQAHLQQPAPTAPGSEPGRGVAPTLPPDEPVPPPGQPTQARPTGTVLGAGPAEIRAGAEYGSTSTMAPYGYGPSPNQVPPPQAPAMAMYPPTAPPTTRVGGRSGLSLGIIAAITGALAVVVGLAIWVGMNRDTGDSPTGPSTFATVTATQPTSTTPPGDNTPPPVTTTATPTSTRPPTGTSTAVPTKRDAGADGGGEDAGYVVPFPLPLPSGLPSTLPPMPTAFPSTFPIQIPGFPQ